MAKGSGKLLDVLTAQVTKKEDQKAIEAVTRQVKSARKSATVEIANLDEAVDIATDRVECLTNSANTSLQDLLAANRALDLAKANLKAAQELFDARF